MAPSKKCIKGGFLGSAQFGYSGLDQAHDGESGIQHLNSVNSVGQEVVNGFDTERGMSGEHYGYVPGRSPGALAVSGGGKNSGKGPYEGRTKEQLVSVAHKKGMKVGKSVTKSKLIAALRR